ncbi:MAG: HD domain-containing protein [Deltaproteobacteria bacterium]|nr:HD domain-containing protein [Deltaproteobacteria bacterium]
MKRAYRIQRRLMEKIAKLEREGIERDTSLDWERIHMVGCARNGYFLAQKRKVDAELAVLACSVHDYGRIVTGKQDNHAAAGFEPLKVFLAECDYLDADEIDLIAVAAKNHSNKGAVGTPLDEAVKDADVLDCYQYGIPLRKAEHQRRLKSLLIEMEL